jgi:hypothetical protein
MNQSIGKYYSLIHLLPASFPRSFTYTYNLIPVTQNGCLSSQYENAIPAHRPAVLHHALRTVSG